MSWLTQQWSLRRARRARRKPPQLLSEFHPLARHRLLASQSAGKLWQVQWLWHGECSRRPTGFSLPACTSFPNSCNYCTFITRKQPATIKLLILIPSFPSLVTNYWSVIPQKCGRLMRPEICYFPAAALSTKNAHCRVQSCNTLWQQRGKTCSPELLHLKGGWCEGSRQARVEGPLVMQNAKEIWLYYSSLMVT